VVVIFGLLTYMEKEKMQKKLTNTNCNPTTNHNPEPTIEKVQAKGTK